MGGGAGPIVAVSNIFAECALNQVVPGGFP